MLDRHCAEAGRDPAEIRRSVQFRIPEATGDLLPLAESYAQADVTEILLILTGDNPVAQAERAAALLPRLRAVG